MSGKFFLMSGKFFLVIFDLLLKGVNFAVGELKAVHFLLYQFNSDLSFPLFDSPPNIQKLHRTVLHDNFIESGDNVFKDANRIREQTQVLPLGDEVGVDELAESFKSNDVLHLNVEVF
jgi:hypothetical protein